MAQIITSRQADGKFIFRVNAGSIAVSYRKTTKRFLKIKIAYSKNRCSNS